MKLAFWRKSSPDDEKRVAEATTPAANPLAKVLRRFTAPEPDWRELEEALLASDVGLVATTALIQAARDGDGASGRARVRAAALSLLGDDSINLHDDADVVGAVVHRVARRHGLRARGGDERAEREG